MKSENKSSLSVACVDIVIPIDQLNYNTYGYVLKLYGPKAGDTSGETSGADKGADKAANGVPTTCEGMTAAPASLGINAGSGAAATSGAG